jgi:hypothetical protein
MSRARTFADLATASEAGDLGRRNMIINGNMEVAQRSTSVAVTASAYHTCDRWGITLSSAGRFTMSQESITDLEGFGKALKLDCTTADTSIASDEILLLYQRFEGQFLQKMQKGFSTAKPVTLSFYVKGNANATYVAELLDADNSNRHINKSFSVTTSWSRVSLTFPGDTTGKLDADNANSLRLHIWLHGGSNYTSGTLQTSWGSIVQANRAAGITSFFDSTDREFFITGVQMELGEVATPFEHETFTENLIRCQRYYQISGTARTYGIVANQHTATTCYANLRWWQLMRAAPTVTIGATSAYNLYNATENITISDIGASQITANSCELYATTSSRTAGTATHMNTNGDTTFWKADSEL